MNWLEIQNHVKRRLGFDSSNTSDPYLAEIVTYCNEGQDYLILRDIDGGEDIVRKFPELKKTWTGSILTVAGDDTYSLPADMLILHEIYSLDSSSETVPSSTAQAVKLGLIEDEDEFWQDPRTGTGWPRTYVLRDDEISILPVPSSGYETNLLLTGLMKSTSCPASNPQNASPSLSSRWHMAIVDAIVFLIADHRGWVEMAAQALSQMDRKMKQSVFAEGQHRKRQGGRVNFRGRRD